MEEKDKDATSHDLKLNRREFLATGIVTGFTLAAGPLSAWAITTDANKLKQHTIDIKGPKGDIPTYIVNPEGKGPFPVIVVVHEIFGVHEHIQDVCRRFAKEGFLAMAPYLYARQGDVTKMKDSKQIFEKVVNKVKTDDVLADIDAVLAYAKNDLGTLVDMDRVSMTGFCWGGRITWLYGAHNPKLKAGVAWYGPLVQMKLAPVEIATTLRVPILGLYGGKDDHIPQTEVKQMNTLLKKGSTSSHIEVFESSPHGFFADYRESYRKEDAEKAWKMCLAWLKENRAV